MMKISEFIRRPGFHSFEKTAKGWKASARFSLSESIVSIEGESPEEAVRGWEDYFLEVLLRGLSFGPRKGPQDNRSCLRSNMAGDRPISFEELKNLYNYWWVSLSEKDRAPIPQDLENGCVILTPKSLVFLQERDQWRKGGADKLIQMTFDFLDDPKQYFAD